MPYNPEIHHRRSIRLKGYDYSGNGAYFITICAHNRECIFGKIATDDENKIICDLNEYGEIAFNELQKTSEIRKNVDVNCFIVMPNHIHAIIEIHDYTDGRGTVHRTPTVEQFGKPTSNSIPTIIRSYKATVTTQINQLRNSPGETVWQRNYHEHIIRNEKSFEKIQNYILSNPEKWEEDKFYVL